LGHLSEQSQGHKSENLRHKRGTYGGDGKKGIGWRQLHDSPPSSAKPYEKFAYVNFVSVPIRNSRMRPNTAGTPTWFGWAHYELNLSGAFAAVICPVGLMISGVWSASSRTRHKGRIVIVTDVGCGMRWTLGPRETSSSQADGEDVWLWRFSMKTMRYVV
jgi:hypothetical protein